MAEVYKPGRHKDGSVNTLIYGGEFQEHLKDGRQRCKASVNDGERWSRWHQCSRAAVDGGWCKQHQPDAEAKRAAEVAARQQAAHMKRSMEFGGPGFYAALKKIADGDNDPRATAAAAIAWIREQEKE